MATRPVASIGILLLLISASLAQSGTQNAHKYRGGPKTEVPHGMRGEPYFGPFVQQPAVRSRPTHQYHVGPKMGIPH